MKAIILAIGTEITDGQIINSNASFLSEKLSELGIEMAYHLSVPDDRDMILNSLNFCSENSDFIFVTGGLGPTSDDFTRFVISDWLEKPLNFYNPSWEWIVERCGSLNIPVAEAQKQQCYYPEDAQIINNAIGTADAFYCQKEHNHIWALPGPPGEIKKLWPALVDKINSLLPVTIGIKNLHRWHCMGQSESIIGELVESALNDSGLQRGYRAHFPYVEVKVWCDDDRGHLKYLNEIDRILSPWLMAKNSDDLAFQLCSLIEKPVSIYDYLTKYHMMTRLKPFCKQKTIDFFTINYQKLFTYSDIESILKQDPNWMSLILTKTFQENEWFVGMKTGDSIQIEVFNGESSNIFARSPAYVAEKAFQIWIRLLKLSI